MFTRESGLTIRLTVTANICIIMVLNILATGKMINSMVKAKKLGQVIQGVK